MHLPGQILGFCDNQDLFKETLVVLNFYRGSS